MASATATSTQTIEALLDLSRRDHVPLSHLFVQGRTRGGKARPGPLAAFVRAHHGRALHQYLLLHAAASAAPWSVARDSKIWARALGLSHSAASSRAAISKNWAWLEDHDLITRGRRGRLSDITLLRDDGSGRAYVHPVKRKERYLKLPYSFWRDGWYQQLDLPAIAVLLIGLSLDDGFRLPGEYVNTWYGISSSSLTKGLGGLRRAGLLDVRRNKKVAPLAPEGFTFEYTYTLQPPFGPRRVRKRERKRAK